MANAKSSKELASCKDMNVKRSYVRFVNSLLIACKPRVRFSVTRVKPVNPYCFLSFRQTSSFEL